ncbi:GGDEF domain protein [uncultured Candidatus Thioglobus sp.]|nr:GGDEF domain protein [uncultured Candidatus Thioglobus sp.]
MSNFLENELSDIIFRGVIQNVNQAVVIADHAGNVLYLNFATELLFGYSEAELLGKHVHDIFPTYNLRKKANLAFKKFQKTGNGELLGNFLRATALHKDGRAIDIQFTINTVETDGKTFIFSLIQDISDIIDMDNKNSLLETLATTDELTRIFNRRAFFTQAGSAFSLAIRHKEPFSFLMIDLDHFKNINDKYGHDAGDHALQEFADIVSRAIRSEDIFGRIGGEEFCIAMVKTAKEVALVTAERIRKKIAESKISYEGSICDMTISIGLSVITTENDKLSDVLKRADKALYEAKDAGRNKVVFA